MGMQIKKGQILELEIIDMAFGGKGVAKVDGLALFVDGAVAGDTVMARVVKKKKSYAEARAFEIISKSASRIDPKCQYHDWCGGCKWQFLSYEKQLTYKQNHVKDCVERIGLLENVPVLPVLPSKDVYGYRNKMEFTCTNSRWLLPHELNDADIKKGLGIGLHVPGTYNKVIDIDTCHLQADLGNDILRVVRQHIADSNLPVYDLKTHEGFWRFVMLRHSVAQKKWMVNLITAKENNDVLSPIADHLMTTFPEIGSVVNNVTSRRAGVAVGEYEVHLAGEAHITDMLGPFEFKISANSFFQTNTPGAETLYKVVEDYADLSGTETVLDLYSGTGTIPIWLSQFAKNVTGIEIVESAVKDANLNAAQNNVSNCRFVLGDIKEVLPSLSVKPDVMIIDPPRVGMHKHVVKEVLQIKPDKIVYVSCNPSTLSRDLALLKAAYSVEKIQPVDMFPHTFHIESVVKLTRK